MGPPQTTRAAVLLYSGCTIAEIIELSTRLAGAGIEVRHVAAAAGRFRDRSGLWIEPDIEIASVETMPDVLVVPGGDPGSIMDDADVLGFVASVGRSGSLLAGICAGVLVLGAAGVLIDRSITHNYRSPWAPPEVVGFVERFWTGAIVEPDRSIGVVVDGPVITALPNATIEFATSVCRLLGLYEAEQAELIGRHLRGDFVEQLHRGA